MSNTNLNVETLAHTKICAIYIESKDGINILSTDTLMKLDKIIDDINRDENINVVIFTGVGRSFFAGADIKEMISYTEQDALNFSLLGSAVLNKIEQSSKIMIAAVNGYALGGGCEFAMACDIRIASNKAKFGHPEVNLGIIPGFSGTQRLPKLVGIGRAKELILTGRIIDAEEALNIGLITQVVDEKALMSTAFSLSSTIDAKSSIACKNAKFAIDRGIGVDIGAGIAIESRLFQNCFAEEDCKKRFASFLEK
ncbi:MAG: enoyl-CoA hydratase/isomerase family protein [Bacteroidales bacterium]|jgi:enoyl-CoA hydratase|nr:enoyl-CoA hydratase/isomerase family protein [Bacteroidales bacterium]